MEGGQGYSWFEIEVDWTSKPPVSGRPTTGPVTSQPVDPPTAPIESGGSGGAGFSAFPIAAGSRVEFEFAATYTVPSTREEVIFEATASLARSYSSTTPVTHELLRQYTLETEGVVGPADRWNRLLADDEDFLSL